VSLSSTNSPRVEQLTCTTSPALSEPVILAPLLGLSRTAIGQSRPPHADRTVNGPGVALGELAADAGAIVVVIAAVDAVVAALERELSPPLRLKSATAPTAATTTSTTTIAATISTRLRDRAGVGISSKGAVGPVAFLKAAPAWSARHQSSPGLRGGSSACSGSFQEKTTSRNDAIQRSDASAFSFRSWPECDSPAT
jgi:hypothetical protein